MLAPGWIGRAVAALAAFGLLAGPLIAKGQAPWRYGSLYFVIWIIVGLYRAWNDLSPKHMQLVRRNYVERKLILYRLIQDMQHKKHSTGEVIRFREEALQLIANYVRSHRSDRRGTVIYANLLVPEAAGMRVVARDKTHRGASVVVPKDISLAWRAFETAESQVSGDIYADQPDTPPGKPYASVLAIPVLLHGQVLGVVSIDSSRRYHFDRDYEDLVKYLMPYVGLLAWTLISQTAIVLEPSSGPPPTGEQP